MLIESGAMIIAASLVVRLVRFRRMASIAGACRRAAPAALLPDIALIRRAIEAWARRLPWRTLCFEQGLAAHWMLRRRGLASTLFYGAGTIDGALKAHVWVRSGDRDVIGCENAGDYALLASFPAEPSSLPVKPLRNIEKA